MIKKIKLYVLKTLIRVIKSFNRSKKLYEKKKLMSSFKSVGTGFKLSKDYVMINPQYVDIGNNFKFKSRFRLEAIDKYGSQNFTPIVKIGNNVSFNYDVHIGCINQISIGDNCLFGSRILITDHNHGEATKKSLNKAPEDRMLISKGNIVIGDNVWVGEGVAILAGVTIGKNSIVSANSVITKNVPPNVMVGGVPAKIIKYID